MGNLAIMGNLVITAVRGRLMVGGASLLVLGAGPGLTWGSSAFPLMLGWSLGALACLALLILAITQPALACGDPWQADGPVLEALRAADRDQPGRIRVVTAPFFWGDVEKVAGRAFRDLEREGGAGGVLIFLVPSRGRCAVLGDAEAQARVGPVRWKDLGARLACDCQGPAGTEGVAAGVRMLGDVGPTPG
jgi:hypothetical protein